VVDVAIVGGGVGGLCAAIRLRAAGHQVNVFERNAVMGGKLAVRERDGFTFDIGPSLLTLPNEFDDVLRLAGTTLAEQVDLVRLDPQFRYHFSDGSTPVRHRLPSKHSQLVAGPTGVSSWPVPIASGT
jgi:phytoene dehydrogenase-like protein